MDGTPDGKLAFAVFARREPVNITDVCIQTSWAMPHSMATTATASSSRTTAINIYHMASFLGSERYKRDAGRAELQPASARMPWDGRELLSKLLPSQKVDENMLIIAALPAPHKSSCPRPASDVPSYGSAPACAMRSAVRESRS